MRADIRSLRVKGGVQITPLFFELIIYKKTANCLLIRILIFFKDFLQLFLNRLYIFYLFFIGIPSGFTSNGKIILSFGRGDFNFFNNLLAVLIGLGLQFFF